MKTERCKEIRIKSQYYALGRVYVRNIVNSLADQGAADTLSVFSVGDGERFDFDRWILGAADFRKNLP